MELKTEDAKVQLGRDDLPWLGKPFATPKMVLTRPADAGLDEWWEVQTAEQESFDADESCVLKMACKRRQDTSRGADAV